MPKRFFKLIYILALIGIALSLPITILRNVQFDRIVVTTYKAKCISNNQYVVLEGSQLNEVYIFDEITLEDTIFSDTKKTLNFYCRYYDSVRPYIVAYTESKTNAEVVKANQDFFKFQQSVISNVYAYPAQYQLEVVDNQNRWNELYNPIIEWLIGAIAAFVVLQIIRMCYVYVAFGEVVWHPFRQGKKKDDA